MDRKKSVAREPLGTVVAAIIEATGWRRGELARRLGVSVKSLGRYGSGPMPPAVRARDMVRSLEGIDPALQLRLAQALDVDMSSVPGFAATKPSLDPTAVKGLVTMAIYAAADDLDLTPAKTRAVVRMFLGRMVELGLDAATVRAALLVEGRRNGA
jgi:hypothetical protein